MSIIIPANSAVGGGFEVANSCRFDFVSKDELDRTPSTNGSFVINTWSFWVKRKGVANDRRRLFSAYVSQSNNFMLGFDGSDRLEVAYDTGSFDFQIVTTRLFRDSSAWYNIVVTQDAGEDSSDDRIKIYVNGVRETSFAINNRPSLNEGANVINATSAKQIIGQKGDPPGSGSEFFEGYMAEAVHIDGTAYQADSFGEFDSDSGIWKPIESVVDLTFGTNGFYLPFTNSGALGEDFSGKNNDLTVSNLTSIDQTTDTCTNNFATWNPILPMNSTTAIAEGNLKATTPSNYASGASNSWFSTMGFSQGKWYAEFKPTTTPSGSCLFGIGFDLSNAQQGSTTSQYNFAYSTFGFAYQGTGGVGNDTVGYTSTGYDSYTANDIIGIAVDVDNSKLYVSKNGTWQNSANPSSGTGGYTITADKEYFFAFADNAGAAVYVSEANFGNAPYAISSGNQDGNGYGNFEYAVPSGYYALNTKNLAEYG